MDAERFAHFIADLWDEYLDWYSRVLDTPRDRNTTVVSTDGRVLQVIRVKQYGPTTTVDASEVRDEVSLPEHTDEVDAVVIVTTGEFDDEAWQAAPDLDVVLVDIDVLLTLIDDLGAESLVAAYFDDRGAAGGFGRTAPPTLVDIGTAIRDGLHRRLRAGLGFVTGGDDVGRPR